MESLIIGMNPDENKVEKSRKIKAALLNVCRPAYKHFGLDHCTETPRRPKGKVRNKVLKRLDSVFSVISSRLSSLSYLSGFPSFYEVR